MPNKPDVRDGLSSRVIRNVARTLRVRAMGRGRGPAVSSGAAPANTAGSADAPSAGKPAAIAPLTRAPLGHREGKSYKRAN
jgi:hypothetical protein